MNRLALGLLCGLLAVPLAGAQAKSGSGLPALIDRDLIFGNPEIAGAQLSPDGQYVAFLKPWNQTRNIYVKGVGEPFSAARLLTTETKRPVAGSCGRATASSSSLPRTTTAMRTTTSTRSIRRRSPRLAPMRRPRAT